MFKPRILPCLLLQGTGLVKTIQFKNPTYVGDATNAVRIFNKKEVDELIFLDITATQDRRRPSVQAISQISDECFMPLCAGGGIRNLKDIKELINAGAEKVVINTYAVENPSFIKKASLAFGSQSIVVSIDTKKTKEGGYEVFTHGGTRATGFDPVTQARKMEQAGAGEIMITSIDRDGTMTGYDIPLTEMIVDAVNIPVITCGGAGRLEHFSLAMKTGVSALAAGSFFIFYGKRRAVLINFPTKEEIQDILK